MGRTHLAIAVELVHGSHTGDLWPRPGRVLIASRSETFEQFATAIDDAFARWDRSHLHEFTLAAATLFTIFGADVRAADMPSRPPNHRPDWPGTAARRCDATSTTPGATSRRSN